MNIKNKILINPEERYCEIYKINCKITNKSYIGQAVSHILNHKKYRPYGMIGRFKCHISEAFSNKKNQCHYLNNAIRKYGSKNFTIELLFETSVEKADFYEKQFISEYKTLFPNGYNLNSGGSVFRHTNESKKRVSNGLIRYYNDKKYQKFMDLKFIPEDHTKYLKPLRRYKQQYGWYIYINGLKADFGGVHISLEESKKMALDFFKELRIRLAKHLVAGNSLESSTTTS